MSFITVHVESEDKAAELEKALKEFDGVEGVEIDGDTASDLLSEIGRRLYSLENSHDLDCPLRDMREKIEKLLNEDMCYGPKASYSKPDILLYLTNGHNRDKICQAVGLMSGVRRVTTY